MGDKSRYFRTGRHPLPKKRRSKIEYGSFEDSSKYIRCFRCGFLINTTTADMGGSGNGNTYSSFPVLGDTNDREMQQTTLDSLERLGVVTRLQPDGTPMPTYTPMKSQAISGCPLCGTRNLP